MKKTNDLAASLGAPVFSFLLVSAVFMVLYFAGLKAAFEPLVFIPMIVGAVSLVVLKFSVIVWYNIWRKVTYYCAALILAEILLSFWVVDVGGYWSNQLSNSFRATRVLETPTGPVRRVFFDNIGLARRPCLFCADEPVVCSKVLTGQKFLFFADAPKDTCVWGRVSPKMDPAAMVGLFLNEVDPQQAMEAAALARMRQCADRYKQWPEGAIFIRMECPTEDLSFNLERVAVGICTKPD
jgi:hypothetical protein